jgi:hypothetical protein
LFKAACKKTGLRHGPNDHFGYVSLGPFAPFLIWIGKSDSIAKRNEAVQFFARILKVSMNSPNYLPYGLELNLPTIESPCNRFAIFPSLNNFYFLANNAPASLPGFAPDDGSAFVSRFPTIPV